VVQAWRVVVDRAGRLRLAQADRAVGQVEIDDGLAALAPDRALVDRAELHEQRAIERQAALHRGDAEVDVVQR
jgi:hypothetical protein